VTAAAGLLQRCLNSVNCEPIPITRDEEGNFHFAGPLPLKTVVDMHNIPFGRWFHRGRNFFTIELDGREVTYERVAVTPEGNWICTLKVA
jgi:hypothetical protein